MPAAKTIGEIFALPETGASKAPGATGAVRGIVVFVLAVGFLVGAAYVVRAFLGEDSALGQPADARAILQVIAGCILAGLLEEALFRGAAFPLFIGVFRPNRDDDAPGLALAVRRAAIVQAAIFALLHLTGAMPETMTWVVAFQAAVKTVGALCFGIIMAALYVRTRNLLVPMGVHVAYDLLSLAPQEILFGPATTYLTGNLTDALIQGGTALSLLICAMLFMRRR